MKYLIIIALVLFQNQFVNSQTPTVQPFLADIIQQFPTVRDLAISPNQEEVFFTAQSHTGELSAIIYTKKENGKWLAPQVAPFSGQYKDLEPAFSPDGLRLYFVSDRPNSFSESKPQNMDIWYLQRKTVGDAWSAPLNLGSPVNTEGNEFYPSLASNGNLYFTSDGSASKGKDDIFVSYYKENQYQSPVSLSEAINTASYEFNAYIAPDESFLLFSGYNRKDGLGSGDLYISYQKDGQWTTAQNLGAPFNSTKMDYCPFVDVTTKTLYFTSKRNSIPTSLEKALDKEALLELMNQYENGLSRLYQVSFESFMKGK